MEKCVITSAARTAVGAFLGGLKEVPVEELAVPPVREVMRKSNLEPKDIEDIVMGQVISTGDAPNVARSTALLLGMENVPGMTVNRLCGSSLQSIVIGSNAIRVGASRPIIAGGVESLSRAPYYLPLEARYSGFRNGGSALKCGNEMAHFNSQPSALYPQVHMGVTAENIVRKYGISREAQDEFALDSQMKTKRAVESGRLAKEIVPVEIKTRKGTVVFDKDEHPRPETTMEGLAKLKPVFLKDGTVTAGNASGMNDAAAAVALMSEKDSKERGVTPLVYIVDSVVTALDPMYMGLGPVESVRKLLSRNSLRLDDIGLIELNEAFAGQSLGCMIELGIKMGSKIYERMNVNGGAIALGHPLGMTGARLVTTLVYEMKIRDVEYGLATACIGGGQGIALLLKNA